MRKSFLVFAFIIFAFMFCSCGSTGSQIKPIKTKVIDFDINVATQMVKKGEKIIADITIKDTFSRTRYILSAELILADMQYVFKG